MDNIKRCPHSQTRLVTTRLRRLIDGHGRDLGWLITQDVPHPAIPRKH